MVPPSGVVHVVEVIAFVEALLTLNGSPFHEFVLLVRMKFPAAMVPLVWEITSACGIAPTMELVKLVVDGFVSLLI